MDGWRIEMKSQKPGTKKREPFSEENLDVDGNANDSVIIQGDRNTIHYDRQKKTRKKRGDKKPKKTSGAIIAAWIGFAAVIFGAVITGTMGWFPFTPAVPADSTPFVIPTKTPFPTPTSLIGYAFINSEIQPDGTKKNTVDLSIDSIGVGQLTLSIPSKMELGNTDIVRLSIAPDNSLSNLINISVSTQNSDTEPQPFQFTDKIDIYPIMQAELLGAGFDITSNDKIEKIIFSDRPTEWIWTIKAKDEGSQLLVVQISIPAIVDGIEKPISSPLKNVPAEIKVTKSFNKQISDAFPYLIPSLIGLLGVSLSIYANNQVKERERKILELEKLISDGTLEKWKLNEEITRLKSIPKWKFWHL